MLRLRAVALRRVTYPIEEFTRRKVAAEDMIRDGRLDIYPELKGKDLFRVDLRPDGLSIFARGHLGLIPVNDKIAIEVTPRVSLSNVEEMLLRASGAEPLRLEVDTHLFRDSPIRPSAVLDLFAQHLTTLCNAIHDEGVYREYRREMATGLHPRGRIDPYLTARSRAAGSPMVASWTAFNRTRDNGPNRIIRLTINILLSQYHQMRNRTGAHRLASQLAVVDSFFPDVKLCSIPTALSDPLVQRPELIPAARPSTRAAVELSKAIISGRGVELRSTDGALNLPTLLIDMSDVFEKFTRNAIRAEFQARGRFTILGGDGDSSERYFSSVINADDVDRPASPDIVIRDLTGRSLVVGDMKYKPYEGKPKREDLDQVLTYSIVYRCSDVLLVYAAKKSSRGQLLRYGTVGDVTVHILVLDLSPSEITKEIMVQAAGLHAMCDTKFHPMSALRLA